MYAEVLCQQIRIICNRKKITSLREIVMIKIICDNCDRVLQNNDSDFMPADQRISLQITASNRGDLLDMDLCMPCTRKYLAILRGN